MADKFLQKLFRLLAGVFALLIIGFMGFGLFGSMPTAQAATVYLIPDRAQISLADNYAMTVQNGNPMLVYRSQTSSALVLAVCSNPACTTTTTTIRTIEAVLTQGVALTLVNGNPFIVYSELVPAASSRIKVAVCSDATCAQPPAIHIVDNSPGWNVAVTLRNGLPVIAYDEISPSTAENVIKLAICNDETCSAPTIRRFANTSGVNGNAGIGVAIADGNPVVAYMNIQGGVKLLTCATATCSDTPLIQTLEPDGRNAWGISMTAIDSTVLTSYVARDATREIDWLKVAGCTDASCLNPPHIQIVDQAFGNETSITGINHLPVIAYQKRDIHLATCLDIYCNYATGTSIAEFVYSYPRIQTSGNAPVVSFFKLSSGDYNIRVYYGGDYVANPPPTITKTSTMRPTVSPSSTPFFPPNEETLTAVASLSATMTPSTTPTPSHTPSAVPSLTPTTTRTSTPRPTASPSRTPWLPPTDTLTPTYTLTPSDTPTPTATSTPATPTSPAGATPGIVFFAVRHPTLSWNKVIWAQGYQLQIDDNAAFASPIQADVDKDTLVYVVGDELPDGQYFWRVRAQQHTLEWGSWSAAQTFIVSAP